jgi:translation initiation factor 5A
MSDEETFENVGSGASQTEPRQCSALRKNGHVLMKGRPCKIMDMTTSKTGKHGSAKVHMVGIDIFTGKKYEDISPSTANMEVPHIQRVEYILMDITDNYLSLMCDDGTTKDDVPVPQGDVGKEIRDKWSNKGDDDDIYVTVIRAMGEEAAVSVRSARN